MLAQDILGCIADAVICNEPMADVVRIIDLATRESPPHLTGAAIDPDGEAYPPANRILIRRDGTETLVEGSVAPIRGQDGTLQVR